MEALWQGGPVLAHIGDRWAARTSCSLLADSPAGAYVAADRRRGVDLAVALATDRRTPTQLRELRRHMRKRLSRSPVCNTLASCRHMESIYRGVAAEQSGQ